MRWSNGAPGLIDQGYRGEMECIIAKIFGSESQKEAAIELFMKTHGGRSFLHGHMFGDNVHEYLAPCIYEGEGEMLGMAFFKSLVKQHGVQFFEPIGKALAAAGIKRPNMANPAHAWKLRRSALAVHEVVSSGRSLSGSSAAAVAADAGGLEGARRVRGRLPGPLAAGDQRDDAEASIEAGRPAVPHVGAFQPRAGCRDDPLHQPVCQPPAGRDRCRTPPTCSATTCAASSPARARATATSAP